jgi:hypothetical protein
VTGFLRGAELRRLERMMAVADAVFDEAPEEITPGVNLADEYAEYARRCLSEGLVGPSDPGLAHLAPEPTKP